MVIHIIGILKQLFMSLSPPERELDVDAVNILIKMLIIMFT